MTTRASRTLITAKQTPGWLNHQLRRQRFATAGALFIGLALLPPFLGFLFGAFDKENAHIIQAFNAALWNSNTPIMLLASVTLVATVLIPTVIATRRDAAFGDGLSEFLESLGSISSATVAFAAMGLAWLRVFDFAHLERKLSAATVVHAGEVLVALLIGALACGLFAANRVDLSSLQAVLDRDRAELAELRALDARLAASERSDTNGARRRALLLTRAVAIAATVLTAVIYAGQDLALSTIVTGLTAVLVVLPVLGTNLGRFYTVRSQEHRTNSLGFWAAMLFVVATFVMASVFELDFFERSLAWAALLPLLQVGLPIAVWLVLEARLRLGRHASLQLERQRAMIARALASLELRIARQELLERRLHRALDPHA